MGPCSCCPFPLSKQRSKDSLSIDTQHPSAEVQLPAPPTNKRNKKFNTTQLNILKKQQSTYFKNAHLKIDIETADSKILPLIAPKNQNNCPPLLGETTLRPQALGPVKGRLKEQLMQKRSTMDEETSQENHFNQREYFQDDSQQQEDDNFALPARLKKQEENDMTFSGRQKEAVAVGRQFCTHQPGEEGREGAIKEEIGRLEAKLKPGGSNDDEETMGAEGKCEVLWQLAKLHYEGGSYGLSQQHLQTAYDLLKEVQSSSLKFQVLSLLGCILLIQKSPAEAIPPLLKSIRLQVAGQGAESIRLVEPYYWLGEAYLQTSKGSLAKEYLLKSQRGYTFHSLKDPQLLQNIHLRLGELYHLEEEFPEADKHYAKGIKAAQEGKNADRYIQLLLRRAENYQAMESYRLAIASYAATFKSLRRHNLTDLPLYTEAQESLSNSLRQIVDACISQNELLSVIKLAQECGHSIEEIGPLKERLKRMRAILYRQ